jgi:putative SOS response-associated peptidase YedK
MCNLYRLTTTTEAIRNLFHAMEGPSPNLPGRAEFYPNRQAPVILPTPTGRMLVTMRWGVPPPPGARAPVTNIRNLKSPFWRPMLNNRCLVPASAFAEWGSIPDPRTGRKAKHWFALKSTPLFAFAGLWRPSADTPGFAFLTCNPNPTVAAIHPKAMPVLLGPDRAEDWLSGIPAEMVQTAWPDEDMTME